MLQVGLPEICCHLYSVLYWHFMNLAYVGLISSTLTVSRVESVQHGPQQVLWIVGSETKVFLIVAVELLTH